MDFLTLMEFRTLAGRVATRLKVAAPVIDEAKGYEVSGAHEDAADEAPQAPFDHATYECIRDAGALTRWIDRIYARGHVAVDTETTSLDEMQAELVGISLCCRPRARPAYIPVGHKKGAGDLFGVGRNWPRGRWRWPNALALLKPVLEDASAS